MRNRSIFAAILCAVLAACAARQNAISAVDAAYVNRLNARYAQYTRTAEALDQSLQVPAAQVAVLGSARQPEEIATAIHQAAEARARAWLLKRFMDEAAASGALGFMYSWLQNQLMELTRYSAETDAKVSELQTDIAENAGDPDLPARAASLIAERGAEQGAVEELQTIFNDVQGYERDYAGAAAVEREKREAAQQALRAYLSAPRVEVQAPRIQIPPTTYTSCMPNIFGSVNCTSM